MASTFDDFLARMHLKAREEEEDTESAGTPGFAGRRRGKRRRKKKGSALWEIAKLLVLVLLVVLFANFFIFSGADDIMEFNQSYGSTYTTVTSQGTLVQQYMKVMENDAMTETDRAKHDLNIENAELLELFQQEPLSCSINKAYGLLACYNALKELGVDDFQTIGLLACAYNEGSPGLVQYGYPGSIPASLQSTIWKSWYDKPLIADTDAKTSALIAVQPSAGAMGIGTAQWTWGRCMTYLNLIQELYGTSFNITIDQLYEVDYTMYTRELQGSYSAFLTEIGDHDSDLEAVVCYSLGRYEAGYGNYQNIQKMGLDPDKVASWEAYSSTLGPAARKRYNTALLILDMFEGVST